MSLLPIVRWTIGDVSEAGRRCLKKSVDSFRACYGSGFRFFVCHNTVDPPRVEGVEYLKQTSTIVPGSGSVWEFTPPRLDANAHELFVDNDILFLRPDEMISGFFEGDRCLLGEDNQRWYGRFRDAVPNGLRINAGLLGVPPRFLIGEKLLEAWRASGCGEWESNDEQGAVALVVSREPHLLMGRDRYCVVHPQGIPSTNQLGRVLGFGGMRWEANTYHFVNMNSRPHPFFVEATQRLL